MNDQIEAEEAALATVIAARFAEAISDRHPRPKPAHCLELAGLLAAVERSDRLPPGVKVKEDSQSGRLLREASVQANALLSTISEMEKHRAVPQGWRVTDATKAALADYLTVIPMRKCGRPAPMWEAL